MNRAVRGLLIALLVLQGWCAVQGTRYNSAMSEGRRAWNAYEAEVALAAFARGRMLNPHAAETWQRYGDVALYMHDFPDQTASENDPDLLLEQGWLGYTGAVLRSPVDAWSWTGLAEIALNRAVRREQVEGLDLADLTRPGTQGLDPDRAIALAASRIALTLRPSAHYARDVMAAIYASAGNNAEAQRLYIESARLMPAASYHVWGFGTPLDPELYQSVLQGLTEGVELTPEFEKSTVHWEIARFARLNSDYESAEKHARLAQQTAQRQFQHYNAALELSRVLGGRGQLPAAIEALVQARGLSSRPHSLARQLAVLEEQARRFPDACAHYREALRADPDVEALRLRTALACETADKNDLARRILAEGFVLPTESMLLARALVEFHVRQGRRYEAEHLLRIWMRDHPDREEFRQWAETVPAP